MVTVTEHYDAYPYPARDPADEDKRLILGSPSRPEEMDHILWGGRRDWTQTLRILVAGGGSGDGLVQLAQRLTSAGRPYEMTYLDLSTSARAVAEARIARRGLNHVQFVTDSLLRAPDLGLFDYIDCCGVLHHLPDPDAGFAALAQACAPDGGLGFMVYAPHGRSGVYPLQAAFGALFADEPPQARLAAARALYDRLPAGHPIKRNPHLVDHHASDAGFYDLLLHSQDRAYGVGDLLETLDRTGWQLAGFCQPGLYEPERITGQPHDLAPAEAMAVAEQLRGTLKVHVGYARPKGAEAPAPRQSLDRIPHLGAPAAKVAQVVAAGRAVPIKVEGESSPVTLPPQTAPAIAGIDGRRTLAEIAARLGKDPLAFGAWWRPIEDTFMPWGLLRYSGVLRR
ncbi:hypothetical protein JANAI62_02400 [Jannaschia pagri]|uniref:Methyltransferase type 12 domain-containing protein n=1 Tax=Jannaschia pagri TaxID=2829797 RepID=A0ABQ4NGS3_9RHOB|nr:MULTISPECIES: class I SAM-dependent methyltransferase [unclassified Jannaschia]GIT90277.1 hypothetical protein JANAI61_07350 [Jannaschia sp. AI_61]GIT93617.1 hypothetical protein JANAI62_02400 [Jannaschia sp. AI_62]